MTASRYDNKTVKDIRLEIKYLTQQIKYVVCLGCVRVCACVHVCLFAWERCAKFNITYKIFYLQYFHYIICTICLVFFIQAPAAGLYQLKNDEYN